MLFCPAFDSVFPDRVKFWHGWNPCDIASTLPDLQIPFLGGGHELCPTHGAAGFEEEGDADSLEIRYGEDGVTRSQVEVWA